MVNIRKVECPKNKISIKCPYDMDADCVVIHNTDNSASAEDEISYMHSNNDNTSFHFAVDENEIVQGIDLNRNTFNAGDGKDGRGNRKGISIEICRSYCKKKVNGKWVADEERWKRDYKAKFEKAQRNAAELTAKLLKERGWGIDRVKKHQDFSGKYCPRRTLSDYGWQYFISLVQGYMKTESKPTTTTTTSTIKKGNLVSIKSGAKYYNGGAIPDWVVKQKWYVAEVIGDRAVIDKNESGTSSIMSPVNVKYLTVAKATTVAKPTIKVGSTVKIKQGAKTYTGGKLASFVYSRKYKVKELIGNRAVVTYLGITVAAVNVKDLTLV